MNKFPVPWLLVFALAMAFLVRITQLKTESEIYKSHSVGLQKEVQDLKESQNVMVWKMDKSCFDQIKNSSDGILRIQVGRVVKDVFQNKYH